MVNWWLGLVVWMPRDFLISKRDYYLGVPIAFQTTNPNHQFTFVEDVMVQLFQDLSDATLNWSKSRQLGSGSYGAVFKGEMKVQSIHWIDWEHWDVWWSLCQHVFPWCNGKGLQWYSGYAFRTWRHVQKSRHQKAVNFSWFSDVDDFFQCWIQNFRGSDSFTMDFFDIHGPMELAGWNSSCHQNDRPWSIEKLWTATGRSLKFPPLQWEAALGEISSCHKDSRYGWLRSGSGNTKQVWCLIESFWKLGTWSDNDWKFKEFAELEVSSS